MKFPSHILLEVNKFNLNNSSQYWIFKYILFMQKKHNYILNNIFFNKKFLLNSETLFLNKLIKDQPSFTIR